MSALPPKADVCGALAHVRLVPIADIAALLDHLVSAGEQRRRDWKAKYFCGCEINHHFELRWLHYWQVDGLGAVE